MASDASNASKSYTVDDYWAMFRRRRGVIYLVTILAGVFSALISHYLPPRFEARAQFYIPVDAVTVTAGPEEGNLRAPLHRDLAQSYLALLNSRDIIEQVADQFEDRSGYGLERSTDFEVSPKGSILLYVRDRDPKIAADIASAFLRQFRQFHVGAMQQEIERSIRVADKRIRGIVERKKLYQNQDDIDVNPGDVAAEAVPIAIEDLVLIRQEMARDLARLSDPVVVIEQPVPPENPVFPITFLNVVVALIGGFLVGLIYAAILDHIDEKRAGKLAGSIDRSALIESLFQEWLKTKRQS